MNHLQYELIGNVFSFIPMDQRYNAATHLHDHCVVSLISYPVRSVKYDTRLIVGVISINIAYGLRRFTEDG